MRAWSARNRRDFRLALLLNVTLGVLLIVSFASGWIAVWLGLSEFGLHKWSSLVFSTGIVIHVVLHGRMLIRRRRRLK